MTWSHSLPQDPGVGWSLSPGNPGVGWSLHSCPPFPQLGLPPGTPVRGYGHRPRSPTPVIEVNARESGNQEVSANHCFQKRV